MDSILPVDGLKRTVLSFLKSEIFSKGFSITMDYFQNRVDGSFIPLELFQIETASVVEPLHYAAIENN